MTTPVMVPTRATRGHSARLRRLRVDQVAADVFIVLALLVGFGIPGDVINLAPTISLLVAMIGVGALLLAPVPDVLTARVSPWLILFAIWAFLSRGWGDSADLWKSAFIREIPLALVFMVVVGTVPFTRIVELIKMVTIWAIVACFAAAVLTPYKSTQHLDPETGEPVLPGWHGTFGHKNGMAAFLLFGALTFIVFETRPWRRNAVLAASLLLIVLGNSGTGLAGGIVLLIAGVWLRNYQRLPSRTTPSFVVATTISAIAALFITILAAPFIVNLYGKDLTFTGRTQIWSASLDFIGPERWHGYGIGNVWVNPDVEPTVSLNRQIGFIAGHAHSAPLNLMLELGVIGLALFLLAYLAAVARGARLLRLDPEVGFWMLMVATLHFVFGLSETATWGSWLLLIALLYSARLQSPAPESVPP